MKTFEYLKETFKDIVSGPVKVIDNSNGKRVYPNDNIFDEYVIAAKKYFGRNLFGIKALRKLTVFDAKDSSKAKQLKFNTLISPLEI